MDISQSIENLLAEIRIYHGSFGDPVVDLVDFNPLDILATGQDRYSIGAGIALLVNFSSHIDNACYDDAISGSAAHEIEEAINKGYCSMHAELLAAFKSALHSEKSYKTALSKVYVAYVQQNT